ncbi:MAG: tail fiber domain-containing protein [Bradyrhizobium sp.]|nr:tail fiber domain-containing protein [Bradyrhizobium sp.]
MTKAVQQIGLSSIAMLVALCVMMTSAFAACSSPPGNPGDVTYSGLQNVMAYCNGTSWISMGTQGAIGFGTLTPTYFCTASSSTQISCTTQFVNLTTQVSGVLSPANGGAGVNNGSNTLTLGGSMTTAGAFTTVGAFPTILTTTGSTSVTLPTSGTLLSTASSIAASQLTGTVPVANGGTGDTTLTAFGVMVGAGTSGVVIVGPGSAGQLFVGQGAANPAFATISGDLTLTSSGVATVASIGGKAVTLAGALTTAGAFPLTLTTTGATSVTLPASGTLLSSTSSIGTAQLTGIIAPANGGTGVANTATITLGGAINTAGAFTTAGAFSLTVTTTASTSVTMPTSGTLLSTASSIPASQLTGTIAVANGGTGDTALTAHGLMVGEGSSNVANLGPGTASQMLQSGGSGADPVWSTATWPATTTANQILYSSASSTVSGLATANNGVLVTGATGIPSIASTLPSAVQANITGLGTIASGLWNGTVISPVFGGTGLASYSAGDLLYASAANTLSALHAGSNGFVLTLAGGVPTWAASTGGVTSFSAGTTGLTPSSASTGAIVLGGTLGVANGGTGLNSLTSNVIYKGNGTSALAASSLTDNGTTLVSTDNIDASGKGFVTEITNSSATAAHLAKLNTSGAAVISAITDTDGMVGVMIGTNGGNAQIAVDGQAACTFENAAVAGDFVTIGSTTAGDCHDAGTTRPTTAQTIGQVLTAGASGTAQTIKVALSPSALSDGAPTGTGTTNYVARWTPNGTTLGTGTLFDNGTSVGIGTTTPLDNIDVIAPTYPAIHMGDSNGYSLQFGIASAAGGFSNFASAGDTILRSNNNDVVITARNATGNVIFGTGSADTAKMTILNGGNVGIGTTSPPTTFAIGNTLTSVAFSPFTPTQVQINDTPAATAAGSVATLSIETQPAPASNSSATFNGMVSDVEVPSSATVTYNRVQGVIGETNNYGSGGVTALYGVYGLSQNDSTTATVGTAYGLNGLMQNLSTGTITTGYGASVQAVNFGGSMPTAFGTYSRMLNDTTGSVTTGYGAYNLTYNNSTGSITVGYGAFNETNNHSAGTISTAYGTYTDVLNPSGTITTAYGLFIGGVAGTAAYGIYDSSGKTDYFAGNVGIGTTAPVVSLDLSQKTDAIALPSGTTGQRPGTLANGELRYNQGTQEVEAYFQGTWNTLLASSTGTNAPTGSGITNYVARWTPNGTTLGTGTLYDNGTNVGIGTTAPAQALDVWGNIHVQYPTDTTGGAYDMAYNAFGEGVAYDIVTKGAAVLNLGTNNARDITILTNGKVGIGTTAPGAILTINGSPLVVNDVGSRTDEFGATPEFQVSGIDGASITRYTNDVYGPSLMMQKNRSGSPATQTTAQSGDSLGGIYFGASNGTKYVSGPAISATSSAAPGSGAVQGILQFQVPISSTSNSPITAMTIASTGNVGVSTTTPQNKLDVSGAEVIGSTYAGSYTAPGNGLLVQGAVGIGTGTLGGTLSVNGDIAVGSFAGIAAPTNGMIVSGNVGIGTTAPASKLDVNGSIDLLSRLTLSSDGTNTYLQAGTSGGIYVQPNNAALTAVSIVPSGLVGIGTTVPQSTLSVSGGVAIGTTYAGTNAAASNNLIVQGNVGIDMTTPTFPFEIRNSVNSGTSFGLVDSSAFIKVAFGLNSDAGQFQEHDSSGNLNVDIEAATASYFNGGNVGIGTTAPDATLSIQDAGIQDIDFKSSGTDEAYIGISAIDGAASTNELRIRGDAGILFSVSGAPKMTVATSGNVGIGTTSPAERLDVMGNAAHMYIGDAGCGAGYAGIGANIFSGCTNYAWLANSTDTFINRPSGGAIRFRENNNSIPDEMTIAAGGNVGIGTTAPAYTLQVNGSVAGTSAYNNTSDGRLKKDVTPIAYGLDTVMQLRPIGFNWIDQTQEWKKKHQLGLIAQEVEPVVPEVVTIADDKMRTRSLAYGELVPVVIRAVQELKGLFDSDHDALASLQAANDNLRALNDDEEAQIKTLTARLDALQARRQ